MEYPPLTVVCADKIDGIMKKKTIIGIRFNIIQYLKFIISFDNFINR